MASFSRKRKRGYRMLVQLAAESHVPRFQERVGTRHPGYMISDRLPWRLRARPSATLHEIQVHSEERTCCDYATESPREASREIWRHEIHSAKGAKAGTHGRRAGVRSGER